MEDLELVDGTPLFAILYTFTRPGKVEGVIYYLRLLSNGTIEGCKNDDEWAVQGSLQKTQEEWKEKMSKGGWSEVK